MAARVSIGEFSTMTRLTRKALRLYHDQGVLEPADIDPSSGYRFYDLSQVDLARTIRRFRDLDMSVADIKAYVSAPDDASRRTILSAHLDRLEDRLRTTGDAVASLRAIVEGSPSRSIEVRTDAAFSAVSITEPVQLSNVASWWNTARAELDAALEASGVTATGSLGAQFEQRLFADEEGTATLWYPIVEENAIVDSERVTVIRVPSARFAVAVHGGPDARIDETYSALGTYVTERGIGADGPVRERYLVGVDSADELVTEIGWPVRVGT